MSSPLAIIGCGGMGHRHLRGLARLRSIGWHDLELVAVCDQHRPHAESLAAEAAVSLGRAPAIVADLDALPALGVVAVDITTTPPSHHTLACAAFGLGLHVMVEKPMALTVRACQMMQRAASAAGRVLGVAENYRRDPVNRLARALLAAGVIGRPRFVIHHTVGGGDEMLISVWRHQKDQSGILLDVGVHYTDMLEYLLGPIERCYAQVRLHEPVRRNPAASGAAVAAGNDPAGVYGARQRQMPASFHATAEDALYATVCFADGTVGQLIEDHAGHGAPLWSRQIYGAHGSLALPVDRTGVPLQLNIAGQPYTGSLLDLVPDFQLDPVSAALFGGARLERYAFDFAATDQRLLAVEYADFAAAISAGRAPEVDGAQGMRAVAGVYALLESALLDRPVSIAEVLAGQVAGYQRPLDAGLAG